MKLKVLLFILAFISAMSFSASADQSGFQACQRRGGELNVDLGKPGERVKGDNLGHCVENFVDLNAGKNHVKVNDWCGPLCWGEKRIAARWGDATKYLARIKKEVSAEQIIKIEKGARKSLKEIVDQSYQHYATLNKSRTARKDDGYAVFKGILFDVIQFYVTAEIEELELQEVEGIQAFINNIETEIFECLEIAQSKDGIKTCAVKFQSNAVFKIGKKALKTNLLKYFKQEVDDLGFKILEAEAEDEYNNCSMKYYYNPNIHAESDTDKGKACVFSSILEAFLTVTKTVVNAKTSLSSKEVDVAVRDLISQCGDQKYLEIDELDKYLALQKSNQEDYVDYLLSCKDSVKEGAVARIGTQTIASHPAVLGVLGADRAGEFAKRVIKEGLPECLEKMDKKDQPEKCENYLFAKTASTIFPIVLDEKFQEFKSEFKFLSDDLIEKSIQSALFSLESCNGTNQENFEAFLNLNESESDIATSNCVKRAILASLQQIIEVYLESEIANNGILVKYGIEFGPRKKEELKKSFNQCVNESISTDKGLASVVKDAEDFLDICVLRIMKKVVLDTIDLIIEKELRKIGVPVSKVNGLIIDYKKKDDNIFQKIKDSKTIEELESVLEFADKDLMTGVSSGVIRLLIKKKSPVDFSESVLEELVAKGSKSLSACIETKDTRVCSKLVEDEIMALGIELYMPQVLKEKLTSFKKEYPFLSTSLISKATVDAKKELSSCFKWYRNSAKKMSAEQQAANCSKRTIIKSLDRIIDAYINKELPKNKTLKKYGIKFSSKQKTELKKTFTTCANDNISTKDALTSVLRDSETFLSKCAGEAMRKISLGNMKTILTKELKGIGLSTSDANVIIGSYKKKKGNAFSVIRYAKPEKMEKTLEGLDKKIILDLSDDVLRILIRAKSPIKLSTRQMKALVKKGKSSLQACIKKKEISACSGPAEREVMILAVQLYFPSAVATEFKGSVSKWISPSQFKTLKIEKLISDAIYKKAGYRIAATVVSAFDKGSSIKSIQKLKSVRAFIADTLLSSDWRVKSITNFIIQTELDKFVKNPKGFKAKFGLNVFYNGGKHPALKWVNIRDNKSGREVTKLFKYYLRKIVVDDYDLKKSDYTKLEDLVYKAVREYSGSNKPSSDGKVKGKWPKYKYKTVSNSAYQVIKKKRLKGQRTTYLEKKQYFTYLYELNCIKSPNHKESKKSCPMLQDQMKKYKYRLVK